MKLATTRALFAYWDGLRGERTAPERAEIEPAAIRHVLADTFVVEVDSARHCPFRLAGTRLCALFGRELKGVGLCDLWATDRRHEAASLIGTVLDERAGAVCGLTAMTAGGETLELEMILLPLRHGGRTHARMLGSVASALPPVRLGLDPVARLGLRTMRIIRTDSTDRLQVARPPVAPEGLRRGPFRVFDGGRSGNPTK